MQIPSSKEIAVWRVANTWRVTEPQLGLGPTSSKEMVSCCFLHVSIDSVPPSLKTARQVGFELVGLQERPPHNLFNPNRCSPNHVSRPEFNWTLVTLWVLLPF